jgi:hypothetical protein
MLLVESRKRRCDFLRSVASELALTHVEVAEAPLERIETRPASTISARAFAPLDKLLDLSTRFSTESTRWLLPKGRNAVKELALLPQPWQRMFHVEQSRTDADSQILVRNSEESDDPHCRGEPEGRGRQDDDRNQSGNRAGGNGLADADYRSRSAGQCLDRARDQAIAA